MSSTNWQHEWQQSIQNVAELLQALELEHEAGNNILIDPDFPIKVPRSYLARIRKRDWDDPLLRQVLPITAEHDIHSSYCADPVGDQTAIVKKGVLHKYQNRVLLLVTGVCAIHCRYCFRKNFPYQNNTLNHNFEESINYIQADESIEEVILSGGDPLSLKNTHLFELCRQLENISHIRRLRIHTRLPICLPSRLEPKLLEWLNCRPLPYVIVFHINHPAEINQEVKQAVQQLHHPLLLNQAVLLKGVNDNAAALIELSRSCFDIGILPYYLHMLDKVQGTEHFNVKLQLAKQLITQMQTALPGYLVPKLAREVPGMPAKQIL